VKQAIEGEPVHEISAGRSRGQIGAIRRNLATAGENFFNKGPVTRAARINPESIEVSGESTLPKGSHLRESTVPLISGITSRLH
jgi:hypothetical protein